MKTIKKIKPGMKGTKKLVETYGDKLVCVRYRYDYDRKRKVKTIELIIDESPLTKNSKKIPMNKIMQLSVKYGEIQIGRLIRSAGGRWNRKEKVWELPYGEVLALGLEDRMVTKGVQ
jgi:hypothetical protein